MRTYSKQIIYSLLFLFVSFYSFGQTEVQEEVIEAVPLTQIPDFNSASQVKTYEAKQFILNDKETDAIIEQITSLRKTISSKSEKLDSIKAINLSLNDLDKWERIFLEIETKINVLNTSIENKIDAYGQMYKDINQRYLVILETSISIKGIPTVSNELKQDTRETQSKLRNSRKELKDKESFYLNQKSETNYLSNKILVDLDNIRNARSNMVRNLFVTEQPAIWTVIKLSRNDTITKVVEKESNLSYAISNAKSFWSTNHTLPVFYFIIILVLYILIHLFKRNINTDVSNKIQATKGSQTILNKSILSSIILGSFILAINIYLPEEINAIWLLFILVPILILINQLFKKQSNKTFLIFTAYYLLRTVEFLVDETTIYARFGTIFISAISIVLLVKLLNRITNNTYFKSWRSLIRLVLFALALLLLSSIIFNIIGNVTLSNIILIGSIDVIISGVLLLCIYQLVLGFITLSFSTKQSKASNVIKNHGVSILSLIKKLTSWFFIIYWIGMSLRFFGIYDEIITQLKEIYFYQFNFGSTSFAINSIVAFFLSIYLAIQISKGLKMFLEEEVFSRNQTDKGTSGTIILLIRYSVISLGFLIAMAAAGIELEKISIIIGALGVGIGFGLQSIFNNLVSGIILAIERPIAIGDTIEVGALTGTVQDIGFRSSRVRTFDGAEVIVPNGDIVSNQMINWTLSDRKRRLKIDFGVSYDSDPEEVMEVMREITFENPSIVQDPAPRPRFIEFGDSSLNFQLLFWIKDYDTGFTVGTDTMLKLYSKLKERGIKVPFPQRDIHIIDATNDNNEKELKNKDDKA